MIPSEIIDVEPGSNVVPSKFQIATDIPLGAPAFQDTIADQTT